MGRWVIYTLDLFVHSQTNQIAIVGQTLPPALFLLLITFCFGISVMFSLKFIIKPLWGFKVDIVHRDSPLSPFHDPSKTHTQRLVDAARRSISRINHFDPTGAHSVITSANGEYLMNISVGTPPVEIHAIADTGSDLIWTQCAPCDSCYKQVDPLFDSSESSTYRNLACQSTACTQMERTSCNTERQCTYSYGYGDRSYTRGNLATETLRLGPVAIPKARFGCGRDNGGTFDGVGSGIIGLGGGELSLVRQLGDIASGKFSYCLVSLNEQTGTTSSLYFGSDGVVSGKGVVSTPLVKKAPDTFYYLTLEGISVGAKRVAFKTSKTDYDVSVEEGNIIIDSGTTLTLLPPGFFSELVEELKEAISEETAEDPSGTFSLCYSVSEGQAEPKFPLVTAHFTGADVVLKPLNTFVMVREGLVCLSMVGANDLAIFGNLAQMDYLVGYDIEEGTVSFKPTDCSKA